jgi:hypothetical protein
LIGRETSDQGKERMGSSGLVRWGAVSLILGGAAWIVLGLTAVFGYLQAIPGREDVASFGVALLLTAAGLVGLHALKVGSYGLLGRVGPLRRPRRGGRPHIGRSGFLGGKLGARMAIVVGHFGHAGRVRAVRARHPVG